MTKEEERVVDALQNNVWYVCCLVQNGKNLGIDVSKRGRSAKKAANIVKFLNDKRRTQVIPGTHLYHYFHRQNLIDHGII